MPCPRRLARPLAALALVAGSVLAAAGPAAAQSSLRQLGATGDGVRDDTAALTRILESANGRCLDGEGRRYRVTGTIEVHGDVCLANVRLVQAARAPDTSALVARACPVTTDTAAALDCGDPAIGAARLDALRRALAVRTLFIHPVAGARGVAVRLSRVAIDRGTDPTAGARGDSAGLWISNARSIELSGVEISGHGKGYGLMVEQGRAVRIRDLHVHDLQWAPYRGEQLPTLARIGAVGWNRWPLHELRAAGRSAQFRGVRAQEQLAAVAFQHVDGLDIDGLRIARVEARLADGAVPWQTDGLVIGGNSRAISVRNADIRRSWEGIDLVGGGGGIRDARFSAIRVSDSFSTGFKAGGAISQLAVDGLTIDGAGLYGVHVYGPVAGVTLGRVSASGVGLAADTRGRGRHWAAGNRAAIRVDQASPGAVRIEALAVEGGDYDVGLLDTGRSASRIGSLSAPGARRAAREAH